MMSGQAIGREIYRTRKVPNLSLNGMVRLGMQRSRADRENMPKCTLCTVSSKVYFVRLDVMKHVSNAGGRSRAGQAVRPACLSWCPSQDLEIAGLSAESVSKDFAQFPDCR